MGGKWVVGGWWIAMVDGWEGSGKVVGGRRRVGSGGRVVGGGRWLLVCWRFVVGVLLFAGWRPTCLCVVFSCRGGKGAFDVCLFGC